MKYALLISIFLQSSLYAFEFVVGPGTDRDSLIIQKPTEFVAAIASSGGWARTDKGDFDYGSCVYLDPRKKFSVGWEYYAGKVKRVYFSRGPNSVAFKEANLVKLSESQEMVLDTESGDFKIVSKAKDKSKIEEAEAGTGQPATRSESKSEGKQKPEPESEGRSR